jgi:type IV secretory pathway protease TraF
MGWIERVTGGSLRWRLIRAAAFFIAGFVSMLPTFGLVPPLLFRNDSSSEPEGYYLYAHHVPAKRGEIVVLRNPPHFQLTWLMKTVEGVEGDLYCWDEAFGTQLLNGRPMAPPDPLASRLGIPIWHGCRRLEPGEVVGYGRTADSYDSRYFGPVQERKLWGVYRPVLVGS